MRDSRFWDHVVAWVFIGAVILILMLLMAREGLLR
jgi:hypothetical protein